VKRQKTPDRRPNLSRPYIKLKSLWPDCLTGWGPWPDGGHGRIGPLDPPLVTFKIASIGIRTRGLPRFVLRWKRLAPPIPLSPTASAEMEQVYDYVRSENKKKEMKILNKESIQLLETLGAGNFGSVCRGTYKYQTKNKTMKEVPVAVKVLKGGDSPTAEV